MLYFCATMDKGRRETLTTRIISTTFVIVALAVFKPFGLETWQWQTYVHLLALWVLGVAVCMLTDMILKYIVKMPRSLSKGANYIIKRNLWFQLINTPLIALIICLYRHFVLSDKIEANQFSLINYLESFAIIAFCSFAIGLYWRFKFRSRYLAAELEETKLLNEQLQKMQRPTSDLSPDDASLHNTKSEVTLTGTTSETITLDIAHLLYIEAVGNYVKVCHLDGEKTRTDMLRATTKQVEEELKDFFMVVRCHRAFLVNLQQVEQIVSKAGTMQLLIKHSHDYLPVSRSNMSQVKEALRS